MAEKQIPWSLMAQQQAQAIAPRVLDPVGEYEPEIPMMTKEQVEMGVETGQLDPRQPVQVVEQNPTPMKRDPAVDMPDPQQVKNQAQSDLSGDMYADAYLAQKQGIAQLEDNINEMRKAPRGGIDYSPMVAFAKMHDPTLDTESMMSAAKSLRPESPEASADRLFKLQNMLIERKDDLTKRQLENLKERIAAAKAAKIDPLDRQLKLAKIGAYKAAAAKTENGRPLTEVSIQKVTDFDSSLKELSDMSETFDKYKDVMGPVEGRVNSANPYNVKAQDFQADLDRARQVIGKAVEGGVLRKEDEEKYLRMLPALRDNPATGKYKMQQFANKMSAARNKYIENLQKGGYNTRQIQQGAQMPTATAREQLLNGSGQMDGPRDTSQMTPEQLDAYLEELEAGQ